MAKSSKPIRVLVTGAGGFIGHHMTKYLKEKGYWVRGVDIKWPSYGETAADEFEIFDLRRWANCLQATRGVDHVYNFAANMGGIGFIETVHGEVMHDNVLINTHMLEAARVHGVKRYFYSSSACVYATYKQETPDVEGLKESDAYPADPDNEYGWEKLYTERLCLNYAKDYGMVTRIARFHNIYGPLGTFDGGREKSPAAICRKIAFAKDGGTIEIWGDGLQTRSYCYVDDCVEGVYRLTHSDFGEPLNIGSEEKVSINALVDMVASIAGKKIQRKHDLTKPQGVRGRNSENTLIRKVLRWEPKTPLQKGMEKTYRWIESEIRQYGEDRGLANYSILEISRRGASGGGGR
jgi:nucleoside-diphosphate-sugar epimerase